MAADQIRSSPRAERRLKLLFVSDHDWTLHDGYADLLVLDDDVGIFGKAALQQLFAGKLRWCEIVCGEVTIADVVDG